MGVVSTISVERWPMQGKHLGERCTVFFNYDSSRPCRGTIVRDDMQEPWRTIIELDDTPASRAHRPTREARFVLSTECQYQPDSLAPVSRSSAGGVE